MIARHLRDGARAEDHARRYLERRGLKLVARNVSCRFGEIDLVMRDGEDLVFVEVRARRSADYGHPAETIDARKQQRLRRSAEWYLKRHEGAFDTPCRFDVFTITGHGPSQRSEWFRDAFQFH